ncbi:MAG: tRNA-(ms[2]io[6]A)-hydroxylase [Pseudomonadota bacterium]|jgi:tRNA 2-(methylsulfanyl)-N6-isopentenyladenosine37 hydroxylase
MPTLRHATPAAWTQTVLADFDRFLNDHAAAEKKASGMALSMALHYHDRPAIVAPMVDLAVEELDHFRALVRLLHERGLNLARDRKDDYVNALRQAVRTGREHYLLDRLLLGAVVEARGRERFGLIAAALPAGALQDFYRAIAASEARHEQLFERLARDCFPAAQVDLRLTEWLDIEARVIAAQPLRPVLH